MFNALKDVVIPACAGCGQCCHLVVELAPLLDDVPEEFVVEHAASTPPAPPAPPPPPGIDDEVEDGATARITLRLPESVKTRAEELAAKTGSSLNTWIVNVLRSATREGAINIDIDLSSIPFLEGTDPFGPGRGGRRGSRRMTGWV